MPKERYSTGKPIAYPEVCFILDSFFFQEVILYRR
ncbi:hypothetical protein V1498_13485 [Peribacillus sp. SCS-26]